jgi:hypothetical protein
MSTDVPLSCKCGTIRGVARHSSPASNSRLVCYCADCATFAEVLDRPDALNADGGSDIVQTAPSWVEITQGGDQLRCLRLSPKGTHRWYAGCCHTLIANTMGPTSRFVGLLSEFMKPADARPLDEVVGPPMAHVNGRAAGHPIPPYVHPRLPLGAVLKVVARAARWLVAGNAPPFVTSSPGYLRVLTREERQAARATAIGRAGRAGTTSPPA